MPRELLSGARIRVGDHWLDLRVERSSALQYELPGPDAYTPGADIGPGEWDAGPVAGLSAAVRDGARHEVELVGDAGDCWRGTAVINRLVGNLGHLFGDSALERC